jgi:streptogramin lyase
MAPLGDCATLVANASTTFVQINEITTVAAAYVFAPYMTDYAHVGAASVNNTGLINAVGNFNTLASLSSGYSPGPGAALSGATVPYTEINTLANILASCINAPLNSNVNCTTLATATGASDTVGMALGFAKNPGSSTLTALWQQGAGIGAPFQNGLSAQPNDWTIAIKYSAGGNFLAPYGIAIDATGNAWVTNTAGSSVIKLSPAGVAGTTLTGSLVGPKGIAIDRSGNVWVANPSLGTVVEFTGGAGTGTAYTVGTGPVALAINSAGTAWVANQLSNSISSVTSGGTVTSYSTGLNLNGPTGVALDTSGNVYIANNGGGNVVKLTNAGAAATGSPFTDYGLQGTDAIALDSSNNVYAAGSITGAVSQVAVGQFTNAGVAASYSPVKSPNGTATPIYPGIIVTGTNNILMTSSGTASPLQAITLGASPVGNTYGSLNAAIGLAADPSGDVWTANSGDNTVSEFIGLVTPVTTPLAANVGP